MKSYINTHNRFSVYNLLVREFKKSGLTQAQLAKRLGKPPETICRILMRPRNIELDTVSEMLFAMPGAALELGLLYPREDDADAADDAAAKPKSEKPAPTI